jgi:hypothetical protein
VDDENTDPKSVTITGLSSTGTVTVVLTDDYTSANGNMPAGGTATISGGSVTIALKTLSGQSFTDTAWTGTGNYYVFFWPSAVPDAYPPYVGRSASNGKINFSSGTTTVPWSQFDALIHDDDESDNSGNSLTITGITGLTGSVSVMLSDGAEEYPDMPAGGTAAISGGSVTIALKTVSGSSFTNTAWTGAGDYYVFFWNTAVPSGSPSYIGHDGLGEKISFSSAETTVPWSQFIAAVNWTAVADTTFGNDYSINAIAYGSAAGQEKFVAVGGYYTGGITGKAAYSADGVTWTAVTNTGLTDAFGSGSIVDIAYGSGKFVAVGYDSNDGGGMDGSAAYSADGVTWTEITDTGLTDAFGSDIIICGIAYGGAAGQEKFVAVGGSRTGQWGAAAAAYSADGVNWTAVTDTGLTNAFGSDSNIVDIAYGGGKFVAVSWGTAAYSADGVTWTAVADTSFTNYININGIVYGGGKFVAVGSGYNGSTYYGKAAYSADGVNWTAVTDTGLTNAFGSDSNIDDIAYGGGKFVAVGANGKAAYSTDGINWTAVTNTTFGTEYINAIAYGGGKFIAVSGNKAAYWDGQE